MSETDSHDDDEGFPDKAEELFYLDKNGKKQDAALHEELLNNPAADASFQFAVYEQAIEEGMDPDLAHQLYMNTAELKSKKTAKTRFEQIAEEPGIGMDNNGQLNVIGFDPDYLPGGPKDPEKK